MKSIPWLFKCESFLPGVCFASLQDTPPPLLPVSDGIMTLNELPDDDHTAHLGDQASGRSDQICNSKNL